MYDNATYPAKTRGPRVQLQIEARLYLKDPMSTALGERIVEHGILMLDQIGYEAFTFRKLAERIGTTEASVYRYFKSKHRLLLYLNAWYWSWMEYRVLLAAKNVADPGDRLRFALREVTQAIAEDETTPHIDETALYRVVVAESSKAYLNREVDAENREGLFRSYKRLCRTVADMIVEINPSYPYPVALVSTVVESSHMQKYFAEHLPSLTEVKMHDTDLSTSGFLIDLVFKALI
ncbi:MAG: TetR/AcrR family transcriptional regulator [Phycisphaerae bacterium]|nr:TetR/AcrR family transcriptional regulator [Gemmatimonadaceae bacterium]